MPMFLFSGTFFSVSLPRRRSRWWPVHASVPRREPVPWHRLGGALWWRQLVHIAFLSALAIAGTMVGRRTLARRLHA